MRLDCSYRIDVLVEDKLIIERKSVERIKSIHEAQLLTYMPLAGIKIGLLINFNVMKLKNRIRCFVLWLFRALRVLRGKIIGSVRALALDPLPLVPRSCLPHRHRQVKRQQALFFSSSRAG